MIQNCFAVIKKAISFIFWAVAFAAIIGYDTLLFLCYIQGANLDYVAGVLGGLFTNAVIVLNYLNYKRYASIFRYRVYRTIKKL